MSLNLFSLGRNRAISQTRFRDNPAPPKYPLRDPKYHFLETIRPSIEVHCGLGLEMGLGMVS